MPIPEPSSAQVETLSQSPVRIGLSQAMLEAMPAAVCLVDAHGTIVARNRKAAQLPGVSVRLGDNVAQMFGGPDETPWALAVRTGEAVRDVSVAGEMLADIVPTTTSDGSVDGAAISFRAVEPSQDLEDFFENGSVALHRVAADGTILRANQAELDLLGYSRDAYVGKNIAEFYVDADVIADILQRLERGERLDKYPARLKTFDGALRYVQISSSAQFRDGRFASTRCFTVDVTQQKRHEDELRERHRLYHDLLQALPMAIYTTDAEGLIDFYNEAAVEFAGRRPTMGDHWCVTWKLFHADGTPMPHDECPMATTLREGRPVNGMEAIAERPDGTRVPFVPFPTPLFDDAGVLIGAVNVLVDITERKNAEQAMKHLNETLEELVTERTRQAQLAFNELHRSERDFALLVNSVIDYAIYKLDMDGCVSSWNAGAERIKGYTAQEIVGRHFSCFYTEADRATNLPTVALARAKREGRYEAEGWRVRQDGSRFWASVVIDPIYDAGELVGYAKVTRDITERKKAELALIERERLARGVIDTALDGFVQTDDNGRIVEWNPMAETILGWSRQEVIDRDLGDLIMTPAVAEHCRLSLFSGTTDNVMHGQHLQIDAFRKDGTNVAVELGISALPLENGHVFNLFVRDLTEKNSIEAQLRQAQKMEAVGQLTGGIAHDFNNLLQGIIGSLDLVQMRIEQGRTGEVGRFVGGASSSAKRAAALTHRLLAFSRRQPLDPRPVAVNPLIASMEDLLRRTMGERIAIRFDLNDELWSTLCDANQLESALLNLAINARDAMPDGGELTIETGNVELDANKARQHGVDVGEYVCVGVTDTGVGMSRDTVERAFDPFFTTKATGQGTGLGLSMIYGFARQSQGYCRIRSDIDKGTTVTVYLPRHTGEAPAENAAAPDVGEHRSGEGEVVLVVEDEPVVRGLIVEVLHELGYRSLEAEDGLAGLDILHSEQHIDLLITDIGLPGLNGRQMADAGREKRPGLKVLLMTGYAENAAVPTGFLDAGMVLITKPFAIEAMTTRIREMIDGA